MGGEAEGSTHPGSSNNNHVARTCSKVMLGKSLVVLGLTTIAVALSIQLIIKQELPKRVKSFCVIDSHDHPQMKNWVTNMHDDAAPRYFEYMFHHMTNKEAFLAGEAPLFEERGPYVFSQHFKHVGVTFEEDGELLTYRTVTHNTFVPDKSVGPDSDEVTILNIGWAQFIDSWRSESKVAEAGGSQTVAKFRTNFYNLILPLVKYDSLRRAMGEAHVGAAFGFLGLKYPANAFFQAFGGNCVTNGDEAVPPFCGLSETPRLLQTAKLVLDPESRMSRLAGMLLDVGLTDDPIPAETAAKLWDEKDPYSMVSLVEYNGTRSYPGVYLGTKWWCDAATNATILDFLAKRYDMKPSQVLSVSNKFNEHKDSPVLLEELVSRFLLSKTNLEERAILTEQIHTLEDLMMRQLYAGDVLPILLKDPKAQLKKDVNLEFSTFTQSHYGMAFWETGLVQDNLWCMLDFAYRNRTTYDREIMGVSKSWIPADKKPIFTNDMGLWQPTPRTFEECFPDEQTLQVIKEYTNYLGGQLFVPTYMDLLPTEGLVTTNTVGKWVIGTGTATFLDLALDQGDPRIDFALLGDDGPLRGLDQPDEDALCHQAPDPYNIYTACEWHRDGPPGTKVYYRRANHTMYTGKSDIQKVGQFKRFTGMEVLSGVWAKDIQIDNGADTLMDSASGYRPLVQGHTDGSALPPFLLDNAEPEDLNNSYLSVIIESLSSPIVFTYDRKADKEGIPVHRFSLHKDAFTAHRYDAATFGMDPQGTRPELLEVLSLTEARESPLYLGALSVNPRDVLANGKEGNLRAFMPRTEHTVAMDYQPAYMDIEPITGRTLALHLSVRTYMTTLDDYIGYDLFHPTVYRAPLLPIFDLTISQEASSAQQAYLKSAVYDVKKYSGVGSVVGYVFGGSCVLIGLAYWIAGRRLRKAI